MRLSKLVLRVRRAGYRYLGRGAYQDLRKRLDPEWEYSQLAYARLVGGILEPGTRWLDAGCGHKIFETDGGEEERDMVQSVQLAVGCDLGLSDLGKHRSISNRVCCNLMMLPFRDASFDLVTLNNVVEHIEGPGGVFAELARVANCDGRIVIHTPNSASYFVRLARMVRRLVPTSVWLWAVRVIERRGGADIFPTHYQANTRLRLSELFQTAGVVEEHFCYVRGGHLTGFAAPLVVLELLFIRVLNWLGVPELGSAVLLGSYRRSPGAASGLPQNLHEKAAFLESKVENLADSRANCNGFKRAAKMNEGISR
jgi:SAM-dependent methyltransferase